MVYTAQGESRVANITQGKAECYIMRLSPRAVYAIQTKQQCFKWFIVFFTYTTVRSNKIHFFDILTNVNH